MPLVKALKSFKGRYGHIRAGTTFNADPSYYRQLAAKGWVELAPESKDKQPPGPGPGENRDKGGAPGRAGKGGAGGKPAAPNKPGSRKGTAPQRGAGGAVTSRSLRQDLASHENKSPPSDAGEKSPENKDPPPAE